MNHQALLDALAPVVTPAEAAAYTELADLAERWRMRAQMRRVVAHMRDIEQCRAHVRSFTYNGPGAECIGRLIRAVAGGRTD